MIVITAIFSYGNIGAQVKLSTIFESHFKVSNTIFGFNIPMQLWRWCFKFSQYNIQLMLIEKCKSSTKIPVFYFSVIRCKNLNDFLTSPDSYMQSFYSLPMYWISSGVTHMPIIYYYIWLYWMCRNGRIKYNSQLNT